MIVTQIASAVVIVLAGLGALRIDSRATRARLVGTLLSSLAMLLFVRLIVDFGDWTGWFLYVWLLGIAAVAVGVYRAVLRWPDRPAWAEGSRARRSEALGIGAGSAVVLGIAVVAMAPGFLYG